MSIDEAKIKAQIEPDQALATQALALVKSPGWLVADDSHAEQVTALLVEVKRRWKALEEVRTSITKPLVEAQRRANAFFALGQEPLATLERELKNGLASYRNTRELERLASMQAAEVPAPPPVEIKGVTNRTERRFRVVDDDKVPRAFCSPDLRKIATQPTNTPIDGVEWYDHTITTVRT